MTELFLALGEEPTGPLTPDEVRARVDAGELGRDVLAWHAALTHWTPLGQLPGFEDPGAPPEAAPEAPSLPARLPSDDEQDRRFGDLVRKSWRHYNAHVFARQVDEVLLGALITMALDDGHVLIDLNSDGTAHFARLERLQDRSRLFFRIQHLTPDLRSAKVLGHMVSIIVGYGERVPSFQTVWQALKAEYKSGYLQSAEPGTITVDGDMHSSYVYVQVDLFWDAGDYVDERYQIDGARLRQDVGAVHHALRKYLRGRFGG